MARRQSWVLIRKLFGNGSNPCPGLLLHHHLPKLLSNSTQTLTLTSTPSTSPSPSSTSKLLHSPNHLLFLQHRRPLSSASPSAGATSATAAAEAEATATATATATAEASSAISFPSPSTMYNITTKADYERAIKKVKDDLLPAVFFFTDSTNVIQESPIIRKLREKFPHVTIYKVLMLKASVANILLQFDEEPIFHFYQNGKKVDEVYGADVDPLRDTFEKLYRYVIPVESTKPTSSSGMGKWRTQQLVIQAKKDENGKGVKGGSKLGGAGTLLQRRGGAALSQWRGVATLSRQSRTTAPPPLPLVMWAVEHVPGGCYDSKLWWFARGLFKSQPEKRVVFLKMKFLPGWFWLVDQMSEE